MLSFCLSFSPLVIFLAKSGLASEIQPIARTIIALYDGDQEASPDKTRLHLYAELPLNYLGFKLRYLDVAKPLPDLSRQADIAGIISWFSKPVKAPFRYLKWAARAADRGKKFVILGEVGGDRKAQQTEAMALLLAKIGLQYTGKWVEFTPATRLINHVPSLTTFEAQIDPVLPSFPIVKKVDPSVEVAIELVVPNREGGGRSVALATSSNGGYIAPGYVIATEQKLQQVRWLVNPFGFFSKAFSWGDWPKPDITTMNGKRIFFSHVDGLGLGDVTIQQGQRLLVPDLFYEQIGLAYTNIPMTVALTVGDIDPKVGGQSSLRKNIQKIWALPQIEPALNGYSRLHDWAFFSPYDRKREEVLIQDSPIGGWVNLKNVLRMGRSENGLETKKYVASGRDFPREYMRYPFSIKKETEGALTIAEQLLPKNKSMRLYQWTGNAQPDEAMIAATRKLGLLNMNGGGTHLKLSQPSITDVSPFSKQVGEERQIYAIGGERASQTENWDLALEQMRTFPYAMERTEKPYRLTAYNLHYDLRLLRISGGLQAVKINLNKVASGNYYPVYASSYALMTKDFFNAEIIKIAPLQWIVKNRGAVNTLRMNAVTNMNFDLEESQGVLGTSLHNGQLYIALDPSVETAILVARADKDKLNEKVGLQSSDWKVTDLKRERCGWSYLAEGFGQGMFSWYNVPMGDYVVSASADRMLLWSKRIKTDKNNMLDITVPVTSPSHLSIDVKCHFSGKN